MKHYIGYIRVSTVKQGTKGVSLQEQKDAILRYAERNKFEIATWLEEMETAAKQGRPIFNHALKLLRNGTAQGIILHKLDRGARNLRDWASIGELSDQGVEVHFVNESLDLHSRGGRLSADIQAVVAADYIRNLREETRKGFYGRLKQGFYPLAAPVGYLDQGKAKAKTIDPIMGPLVRKAFELYSTAMWNLDQLREHLHELGLRSRKGKQITKGGLSLIFHNPFYIGIMRINKTGENFPGLHEPLIKKSLFDRVQGVLQGKFNRHGQKQQFLFRRLIKCGTCGYSLIAERQKGHVYYRCHTKTCPRTSVREESIEKELESYLGRLHFCEDELAYFKVTILKMRASWKSEMESEVKAITLQLGQIKDRLNRLTDVLIDGTIDRNTYEQKNSRLLMEQKGMEEKLAKWNHDKASSPDQLEKFLELAQTALLSYRAALFEEKREMVKIVTSNLVVFGKKIELEPSIGYREVANRFKPNDCGPERDIPRTFDQLLDQLTRLDIQGLLPESSLSYGDKSKDSMCSISLKE